MHGYFSGSYDDKIDISWASNVIQVHGLNIKNLIKSRSRVASNPMQGDKVNKIELDLNDLFLKCRMNSLIAGKTMKMIIRNSE